MHEAAALAAVDVAEAAVVAAVDGAEAAAATEGGTHVSSGGGTRAAGTPRVFQLRTFFLFFLFSSQTSMLTLSKAFLGLLVHSSGYLFLVWNARTKKWDKNLFRTDKICLMGRRAVVAATFTGGSIKSLIF